MTTFIDIGAYDAKTHFPHYLRQVQTGISFRITHRGEHVADLVPPGIAEKRDRAQAAERMLHFVKVLPESPIDIRALIEEGRD